MASKRRPKSIECPKYRTPTHQKDPQTLDKEKIRFRFDLFDHEHDLWGIYKDAKTLREFLLFCKNIESQTWGEIKRAVGRKEKGTNNHFLNLDRFSKKAKERINHQNLDKLIGDTLFSIGINNCTRLYGIQEECFFRIIWHDPYHGEEDKAAYPVKKK